MAIHDVTASFNAVAHVPVPNEFRLLPPRIMYESDGTTVVYTRYSTYTGSGSDTIPIDRTYAEICKLNSMRREVLTNTNDFQDRYQWRFVFPELRDIHYVNMIHDGGRSATFTAYASWDTTDGIDGTWTSLTSMDRGYTFWAAYDRLRNSPVQVSAVGVRAIKCVIISTHGLYADSGGIHHKIHLYGDRHTAEDESRLAFWHPTDDIEVPYGWFDWGDAYQPANGERQFRIKNLSSWSRAVNVNLGFNVDSETYQMDDYHSLKIGAGAFSPSLDLGTMESGAITGVITLKLAAPNTISASNFMVRLIAHPEYWYQWYQQADVALNAVASADATDRYVDKQAEANLVASTAFGNFTMYRNSGAYRDSKKYNSDNISGTWTGQATLTAVASGDGHFDTYVDEYGNDGLTAEANVQPVKHYATVSMVAVAGASYFDGYSDTYGDYLADATVVTP